MESWTSDCWDVNAQFYLEELNKDEVWEKIPLINAVQRHMLKEHHLVRFRGMIQDMYNPEYFLESFEVENTITKERSIRTGKYRDTLPCSENEKIVFGSPSTINKERRPIYCISIPGINQWARFKKDDSIPVCEPMSAEEVVSKGFDPGRSGVKRSADNSTEEPDNFSLFDSTSDSAKRLCPSNTTMKTESNVQFLNMNLPIPDSEAEACLIHLYDIAEGQLKVNDMIEVAGFLSFQTEVMDDGAELLPPPALVPRLHAVVLRPVRTCNPLLTPQVCVDDMMQKAKRLKSDLKLLFTQLLMGDVLAADYLICHLISRIYMRQDVLVLGKFSLNLSCLPDSLQDYSTKLYNFLQSLVVKSHLLPMSLENMNTLNMIPRKNYETNRLDSGVLQLSKGTHLVVDETQLRVGRLNDTGVRNCRALASLITNQRLEYDFQFYPIEFDTDIPVLILSHTKSVLPSDCHVPLECDPDCMSTMAEVFTAASHYLREPLLSQLRLYLSVVPTADYDLSADLQKMVQEDFVKMRQDEPKTTAQDLHSLLVLAKLLSLSEGCQYLTKECWETACRMESQRKQRILNC